MIKFAELKLIEFIISASLLNIRISILFDSSETIDSPSAPFLIRPESNTRINMFGVLYMTGRRIPMNFPEYE